MNSEQDGNDMTKLAVVRELTNCLTALDQLGANIAAAHVDAAINHLLETIDEANIESKMD